MLPIIKSITPVSWLTCRFFWICQMLTIKAEVFAILLKKIYSLATSHIYFWMISHRRNTYLQSVKNRLSTIEKKYRKSIFKTRPRNVADGEGYPLCQSLIFSNTWGKHAFNIQWKQNMFKKKKKILSLKAVIRDLAAEPRALNEAGVQGKKDSMWSCN